MYVDGILIVGIKGFSESTRRIALAAGRAGAEAPGWTVFAGRNGSGKSTVLQSIALCVAGPFVAGLLLESFAGWLNTGGSSGVAGVWLSPSAHDAYEGPPIEDQIGPYLRWSMTDGLEPSLSAALLNPEQVTPDRLKKLPLEPSEHESIQELKRGPWADEPKGWFCLGYGPFRRLTGGVSASQSQSGSSTRVSRLASLFREDSALVECVPWLQSVYLRRLERRPGARELEKNVLRLLSDGLLPEGMTVTRVDSEALWVSQQGIELPLHRLSDGYRTVTALVLDMVRHLFLTHGEFKLEKKDGIWTVPYEGVVMIDEVDAHLHISWQQRIAMGAAQQQGLR